MSRQWSSKLALLMVLPGVAAAADGDPFDPSGSIAHGSGGLITESPTLTAQGVSAGLLANIAESLVVNEYSDGREEPVLDNTLALALYGGYTLGETVRIEAFAPIYGYVDAPTNDFSGPAFGDFRLQALFPVMGNGESFSLALMPRLTLPTGTRNALLRRGTSGGLVFVFGGQASEKIGWAANLGVTLSGSDTIGDVTVGSDVDGKVSAWYHFDDTFRVGLEGQGLMGLSRGDSERRQSLATADVFAQVTSPQGVGMTVGLGTGGGVGAPEYRLFAGLTYAPLAPDSDGDGFVDAEDGCPSAAEDFDGFEDADGCPDDDNDGDGVADLADGCPMEVEDIDGWEDADGCPDPDNDGDITPDVDDECPNELGEPSMKGCPDTDRDGVADKDDECPDAPGAVGMNGCPDRDNDGVPDSRDECPDEPIADDAVPENSNGCPSRVYVIDGAIRITERVNFDTGRATIRPDSYSLLDDVASVMKDNPQATKIEVSGHTDDRGSASNNQRLSQSRAEAVVAYLTGKGIAESRLTARGYGPDRPIDTNRTEAGRANNRRVEFTITESTPITVEAPPTPGATTPAAIPPETVMERPAPGDSPWTQPDEEAEPEPMEEPETEPEDDIMVPEDLDDADEGPQPNEDLQDVLRRGGNPWGPR